MAVLLIVLQVPLVFVVAMAVLMTCYGAGFSLIPPYLSDIFGAKELACLLYTSHIEKVGLNGNEYVQIPGSSITLHEDGYAYATNDNEFVANGSRFNSDSTVDPTTGEVTDEGWDAINPDGTPRTTNAYYGAAATIFKGEPMDFIVSGNNLNVPTAYWFATNSTVVVPELSLIHI